MSAGFDQAAAAAGAGRGEECAVGEAVSLGWVIVDGSGLPGKSPAVVRGATAATPRPATGDVLAGAGALQPAATVMMAAVTANRCHIPIIERPLCESIGGFLPIRGRSTRWKCYRPVGEPTCRAWKSRAPHWVMPGPRFRQPLASR